jgi:TP901 family phage tail tape measure protein
VGRTLADGYLEIRPDVSKLGPELKSGIRRINLDKQGGDAGKLYGDKFAKGAKQSVLGGLKDLAKGGAGLLVPAGIGAAVAAIGKIGTAYEDNLNIFQAVTKATGTQMDQVSAKARQLGADTKLPGVSAAGAAEAMTELAKSGLSVSQAMDAARGTLTLARAAGISEAQAAEITGNAINAFGLKAKDSTVIVDELAAAANSSSVEIGDVSDAFKMAAAVFSGFQAPTVGAKESMTELNTAIAILGNNGIKGSDAGTSLKQMLLQLTGPSMRAKDAMFALNVEAEGGVVSQKELKDTLYESTKAHNKAVASIAGHNQALSQAGDIAFDASGKMRPLRDIIDRVTRATKGMTAEDRDFAITQIFGADASRSVIALMKGGLPVYDAQRKAVLQVGAASDVAAAKNKGLKGAIDNVRSQMENAAISIYNAVKGPLTKSLNGLADALPGVLNKIGTVFGFLAQHKAAVKDFATALIALSVANKVWSASMAVEAAGGLTAMIAQTRVGIAVTKTWTAIEWLATAAQRASMTTIGTWVGVKALEFGAWVRSTAATVANTAALVAQRAAMLVVRGATIAWTAAQWLLNAALTANPIGIVVVAVGALVAAIIYAWKHSQTFRTIVLAVWAAVKTAIRAVVDWFTGTIVPSFKKAVNDVSGFFRSLWAAVKLVWAGIRLYISTEWNIVKAIFLVIKQYVTVVLPTAFRLFWNIVGLVFRTFGAGVKAIWDSIRTGSFAPLRTFISGTLPGAFRAGVAAITAAWNKVKDAARVPVAFVVNHVINPLISGYNRIAGVFHAPQAHTIGGFASGGRIPGAPSAQDNLLARVMGTGHVLKVATGEWINNAMSTAKNLPLLHRVNGLRRQATMDDLVDVVPDGRARGGPVGDGIGDFFGKVWKSVKGFVSTATNAVLHPADTLKRVAQSALNSIPGGGPFVSLLKGAGHSIIDAVGHWLSGNVTGGALGGANVYGGYRGMERLIGLRFPGLRVISDFRPGAHTLTGNLSYHALGRAVDYPPVRALAAWIKATFGRHTKELITPWQELNLWNGAPHHYTGAVWRQHNFAGGNAHVHWAAALGGLLGPRSGMPLAQVVSADTGRLTLYPGANLVHNGTGRRERLSTDGGGIHIHFHNSVVTGERQAEDLIVRAWTAAKAHGRVKV